MTSTEKPKISPDYLLRGALTRIGDTFDRLTGRRWRPSSTLAASELIERMKKLLDAEAKQVPGKGTVVPHNIQLKMQWDKFSTDSDSSIEILETELLTAAVDHLNDKLYYTYAPLHLSIKPDYFTDGVKMLVSFEDFGEEEREVELNVTVPALDVKEALAASAPTLSVSRFAVTARFDVGGVSRSLSSELDTGGRLTVGRSPGNDLPINDISVSKMHASISVGDDGSLAVADTGSTNGTFIDGERIAYGKAVPFNESNTVKFGTVEVRFHTEQVEQAVQLTESIPAPDSNTMTIDGFEFSSRQSESPEPVGGTSEKGAEPPAEVGTEARD
ncbi:MAG: FHA domain-containing protein [Pyrinomonadaceae bacterium]|nr:FHA domain-containing protein [Pyrinomonadaceae bacterium]